MSNPYGPKRSDLQFGIVEQVSAGMTLAAICAQPGMPCRSTVWKWGRAQPWFADLMRQARRRVIALHADFDEVRARALLARFAGGEKIASILADPAMPGRGVYRHWRQQPFDFAAELYRLKRLHNRERGLRRRNPWAWDRDVADRIFLRVLRGAPLRAMLCADPALPSSKVVARWRREHPEFDRILNIAIGQRRTLRGRAQSHCTPQITAAVADRVVRGASLAEAARARGMPSVHTLYSWKRKHPDFAEAIAGARDARAPWCDDQILMAAEDATPDNLGAARRHIAALKRRSCYLHKKAEQMDQA